MPSQLAPKARRNHEKEPVQPARAKPADTWAHDLQHTAGNRATAQLLGTHQTSLARTITVGSVTITPWSQNVPALFDAVVRPWLENNGFKTYGVKARLIRFIQTTNQAFLNGDLFLDTFIPWLNGQTRTLRSGESRPVLKQFSVMGMGRPAWPAALRELKGVQAGDNLRHVVRNATLKEALDCEWDNVAPENRAGHFTAMAAALGIHPVPIALEQIVKAIYNRLYLNPENLFAGDGQMNQVIGFAADPVRSVGEEILESGEDFVDVAEVHRKVMLAIYAAANKVSCDPGYMQYLLHQIHETVFQAIASLRTGSEMWVPAEQAGELVVDIGLGFGFDLIDGRVGADRENIARRQARLLYSERALQRFIRADGRRGWLTDIYRVFMGLAEPPAF